MNERDRNAADEWIREHLPDPASVVYKVAVTDGKVICGFTVVLKWDSAVRQNGASVAQPDLSEPLRCALQHAGCSSPRAAFRRLEEVITSQAGERMSPGLPRLLKRWKLLLLRICGVRSDLSTTGFLLREVDTFFSRSTGRPPPDWHSQGWRHTTIIRFVSLHGYCLRLEERDLRGRW